MAGPVTLAADAAIAGLGMTELGKVYGRSPRRLAAEAVRAAVADAGLSLSDLDGLLVSGGVSGSPGLELARVLGLRDLSLLTEMNSYGATAVTAVSYCGGHGGERRGTLAAHATGGRGRAREGLPLRAVLVHPAEGESYPVFTERE